MKTSSLATAAALLSASYAASVTIQTTKCLDNSIPYGEQFTIEINTPEPIQKGTSSLSPPSLPPLLILHILTYTSLDLPEVCGLRILSATPDVDLSTVQCQAFRDTSGSQPGSAIFTYANPALIATNPVQEKSIRCSGSQHFSKRQIASANATSSIVGVTSSLVASASESASLVLSTSVESRGPITLTSTTVVPGPSAGAGNSTVPSATIKPSGSETSRASASASSTGAAGVVEVGLGAVGAAFVALLM